MSSHSQAHCEYQRSRVTNHYFLLSSIAQQLSKNNTQDLVYACRDVLTESVADHISTGRDLFHELEHLACFGHNNYEFLQERLVLIGRSDLASMLPHEIEIILGGALTQSSDFGGIPTIVTQASTTTSSIVAKDGNSYSSKVAHRKLLLQISDKLTSRDIKRLSFVCSLPDSLHREDMSAIELFQFLEKQELISPDNNDFLIDRLEEIGRRDVANFLVSLLRPQALLNCLNTSYQHLTMKFHMLRSQNATYATQVKTLRALLRCNYSTMLKIGTTFTRSLLTAYTYETVFPLAKSLPAGLQSSTKLASLVKCTLVSIFEFEESYVTGLKLVHDGCTDFKQLAKNMKRCHLCFQEFNKNVSELQWNPDMCHKVKSEVDNRRTPIGAPANVACNVIYDIAKELYGGDTIQHEREALDQELHILESCHYTYCYKILMYQWLVTLLCLATEDVSKDFKPPLDLSKHRTTLLKIVLTHKDKIQACLPVTSQIIGLPLSQELAAHLKSAGVQLVVHTDKQFDSLDLNFFHRISIPVYTFLLQFLAIAFIGPRCFRLQEVSVVLLKQHLEVISSKPHVSSCIHITAKAGAAFHHRVETFKQKSLEINQLCAPLIEQLTISDTDQ